MKLQFFLVIFLAVCVAFILSCQKVEQKTNTNVIEQKPLIDEREKVVEATNDDSMQGLLSRLPDICIIIVRSMNDGYLGTFIPDEEGIASARFESSGYKINLDSVNINEIKMTVFFSLTSVGNEVEVGDGKTKLYSFEISSSQLLNEMKKSKEKLLIEIQAETVN